MSRRTNSIFCVDAMMARPGPDVAHQPEEARFGRHRTHRRPWHPGEADMLTLLRRSVIAALAPLVLATSAGQAQAQVTVQSQIALAQQAALANFAAQQQAALLTN